ncbi:hypothetical protein [Phytomonospora endophytica]|uniref:tRNA-guanine(15) transglycosylase-like domain-containing protein n=1 Tax=Phytomonospora endophytica TaxID=714109 RepID=A0A841FTH5_9ACTN|nr:hypothetical protein [Phytomonospora endophytica]MBB6037038.1 hypothetical protein [Phytomonospora endophytica]
MGGRRRPVPWWPQAADVPLRALDGRVLTQLSARSRAWTESLAPRADTGHGGLVLTGEQGGRRLRELRANGFSAPILLDRGAYERAGARYDSPFEYGDGLHRVPLAAQLDAQRESGATVALTPTLFLDGGDIGSLVSVLSSTARLDRDDTVCLLPLHVGWLRSPHYAALRQSLGDIRIPTALTFGADRDPFASVEAARRLRELVEDHPGLCLLRTDLAGFDALTRGAGFTAMGATSGHRHAWIPYTAPTRRMGRRPPHVFLPELLGWKSGGTLARVFAGTAAPQCSCPTCDGRRIDRFTGLSEKLAREAATHALFHRNALLDQFHYVEPAYRADWWRIVCHDAVAGYRRWSSRWRSTSEFSPAPSALRFWATSSP